MTGWTDVALSNLLGSVSEVLGTPFPSVPRSGGPFAEDGTAITDRGQLTMNDRAKLQYMGIDPDTASLDQINKALEHDAPASPPPPPPPDPQAPPPPTEPASAPPGMSGPGVDAAKKLDDALAKNHSAINDADDELADAVLKATSSSDEGRKRLQGLQQQIIDEVNKLDSTLDTTPGQQQLAQFLQDKTGDILDVLKNGSLDADSQAKVLDGLTARYQALHDGGKGSGDNPANPGGTPQDPGGTPAPGAAGAPGAAVADPGDPGGAGADDAGLEGGLPSDATPGGLGGLAPAMGALGGLPAALGSAIPGLGGGGGGLGDLGSALGSALRDPGRDSAERPPTSTPTRSKTPQIPRRVTTTSRRTAANRQATKATTPATTAARRTPAPEPPHLRPPLRPGRSRPRPLMCSCRITRCAPPTAPRWHRQGGPCWAAATSTTPTARQVCTSPGRICGERTGEPIAAAIRRHRPILRSPGDGFG